MELKVFVATLLRRWYLVALVFLATVGATLLVFNRIGPTYTAEGAVLIFPPVATVQRANESVTEGNPYLELGGVNQARDIVIRGLTSKATADMFGGQYPGLSYEATTDVTNSAPIIVLTVESDSASTAVEAVATLMDIVPATLNELQAGLDLDADSEITSRPLIEDQRPEVVRKEQIRAAIVAGVAVLGLGLLLVGLYDALLTGRVGKRSRKKGSSVADRQPEIGSDQEEFAVNGTAPPGADSTVVPEPARAGVTDRRGVGRLRPRSAPPVAPKGSANGARAAEPRPVEHVERGGSHRFAGQAHQR